MATDPKRSEAWYRDAWHGLDGGDAWHGLDGAIPNWIDTHAHLDVAEFATDRAAVLARARAAGVNTWLVPAISRSSWPELAALAAQEASVWPAYGLHPVYVSTHQAGDPEALDAWLGSHVAVAVGEIGLDAFLPELVDGDLWTRQWDLFTRQLDIARNHRLPVIIHARRALDQVLKALRQRPGVVGIIHSFSGSRQQAEQALDLGYVLGFGGPVTYPRAHRLRRLVAELPATALVLETDAPDQPAFTHRSERNEPAFLPEIAASVAELRQVSLADLAQQTGSNALRVLQAGS